MLLVNIEIAGEVGVGKTTLAELITKILTEKGFTVENKDIDFVNTENYRGDFFEKKLKTIVDRNPKIVIQTHQMNRGASKEV